MASYNALESNQNPSPYGSGDPYYNQSTGYITPHPMAQKKRTSKWIKIGIPVVIVAIIIAAVVGGVVGSRKKKNNAASSGSGSSGGANDPGAASSAASVKNALGRFATATDSKYLVPIYPSTTNSAAFSSPTFVASTNAKLSWPQDPFKPSSPSVLNVRPDHPRIIAPKYKWDALPNLIANDPYLKGWNETIFANATDYYGKPPVAYFMDGPSGILDNAREVKMRIKAFAYAYRMSKDTKWVDRCWAEILNAAGNGTTPFGPEADRWNTGHFLDTAEFSAAFGIAYDWLYDILTDDQKSAIRTTLIKYGLGPGLTVFNGGAAFGWWATNVFGNWNCVCNGGLTLASLAILEDDTTGTASSLLGFTVDNAKQNCALAPSEDGTWAETANYWYFGTTGHAEMVSSLVTATGGHYGVLDANANFYKTGQYHMAVLGPGSLFDYGDHGPNKFSTTANCMFLYADQYNQPIFALHQRDQHDAAEPWSMFWYNPSVSGAFWDGAPLDHFFDNALDQWAAMRSSWTDEKALYVAIKAGRNQGHQTHNDLDVGDFVLDALGTRWAGELGSSDYRSPDYFTSDAQDAARWRYYRKMTEGQNTIVVDKANQNVASAPSVKHDSSGTTQGPTTVVQLSKDSTAYWTTDMTSAYFKATSMKRGVRLLNGRKQVLLQDEIDAQAGIQWRMHTNATIDIDTSGTSATLSLDGESLKVTMLNPPSGATFTKGPAVRYASDPTPPEADPENPTVTVLIIDLPNAGQYNLQVLFNPQWSGMSASDFVTPPSVPLDNWSLTSHN